MTENKNAQKPSYVSNSLKRGLTVLESFGAHNRFMTLTEIGTELDITKSAAYRVVMTLEEMGFLIKSSTDGRYQLSSRVMDLGYRFIKSLDVNEIVMPFVDELRDKTKLSAHLAILERVEAVYIYRALSSQAMTSNIPIGSRLPACATSIGRSLLCNYADDRIHQLFSDYDFQQYSGDTPMSVKELIDTLAIDRVRGYSINKSNFLAGTVALSTPLVNASGMTVAAINISGTEKQLSNIEPFVTTLLESAKEMSGYL